MNSQSLEELNLNYKELRSLIDNLEQNAQHMKASAAQFWALYVIFQLIIYAQVILLPSAALPGNWTWIPFGLSASVSTAFWLTLIPTVNDFVEFRDQQHLAFLEQQRTYRKIYAIKNGVKQNTAGIAPSQQRLAKAFAVVRRKRYAYVGAVLSALFSFTLLVSYAVFSIPQL
ncbi:hypothetical protein Sango_2243000 [Sesamum angolense]|uniref:Uncharacterized protein n=1 Tax=Sesamum angolense TaxID=2727404 RepID=A0AAE2BKT5_9LAMI|nr:hypothetical protein Sango_2243000 [Sesamum angolense]